MSALGPDALLTELRSGDRGVCYYPSCGTEPLWAIVTLPANVFVFSDYGGANEASHSSFLRCVRSEFGECGSALTPYCSEPGAHVYRLQEKWAFFFFEDNRSTLLRLARAKQPIAIFVGIRDGCMEGGNPGCVHSDPFLTQVLSIGRDSADYFTDHSELLNEPERAVRRRHISFCPRYRHSGRFEFALHSLLVRAEPARAEIGVQDLDVFFPESGKRVRVSEEATEPIARLAPFRTKHREGILAHYKVRVLPGDG